jgi:hypothetical protein
VIRSTLPCLARPPLVSSLPVSTRHGRVVAYDITLVGASRGEQHRPCCVVWWLHVGGDHTFSAEKADTLVTSQLHFGAGTSGRTLMSSGGHV